MNKLSSNREISKLNRRQRKKLRVGEFQELVFEVKASFSQPLDKQVYDDFLDELIALIESRGLMMGGGIEVGFIVSSIKRGSPSEEDRQAVGGWLSRQPLVQTFQVGEFIDGWYVDKTIK